MDQTETLAGAAQDLTAELNRSLDWKAEILVELREAEAKISNLQTSLEALGLTLPRNEQAVLEARLAKVRTRDAQLTGASVQGSDRMQLLHDYLAFHPAASVKSRAVRRHLYAHGIKVNAGVVARMLHAKTGQGLLRRIGRGEYAINRQHPALEALRKGASAA